MPKLGLFLSGFLCLPLALACDASPSTTAQQEEAQKPALDVTATTPKNPNGAFLQGAQSTISEWLLLAIDVAEFVGRVAGDEINDEETRAYLNGFLSRAKQSVKLAAEVSELPGATQDYAEFRSIAAKTQAALEAYLSALAADDEEMEDDAQDMLEEVFDYAAVVLADVKQ